MGYPDLSGWNGSQLATLIVIVFLVQSAAILLVLVRSWRTRGDAKAASENSVAANQQTVATGNGFAGDVKATLAEIRDSITELRTELRSDTSRLETRLDEHMNNHDRR